VTGVEGHLLDLGEEVLWCRVQREQSHRAHRRQLLRHDLGGVEEIDPFEGLLRGVREHLQA